MKESFITSGLSRFLTRSDTNQSDKSQKKTVLRNARNVFFCS